MEVLEEVEEERQKQGMLREEVWAEGEDTNNGIVLVACKDERSCLQLEEFITNGPKKVMHEEWKKYLLNKVQLCDIVHKKKKPKDPKPKGFGILDGAEFGEQGRAKRKRKVGTRNGPDVLDSSGVRNNDKEETSDEIRMSDSENKIVEDVTNPVSAGRFCETMQDRTSVENIVLRRHTNPDAAASNGKPLPPVHFYALESDQPILDILKPSVVIVYHPDMTFVREIEVYKVENPLKRLKVYFIFYEESTEVQKFEASIRRENGAFESLIRQKSMMMIPVDQVIVDMREFMSSLPNVLNQKGMRIVPKVVYITRWRQWYDITNTVLLIEFSRDKSFSF
ncbi:hypothetical protein Fmac_011430 [Flemingia macrophylla]|uniref:Uncharacterized protein n=1 Tax=Flemingia macrophylla TaxID=520843 RepID=A0ABD1MMG1_9FABA